jgi:hypothetical protein
MYLVGTGMDLGTKIEAIDASDPQAVVLRLNKKTLLPGVNVQISGALDLSDGSVRPVRFAAVFTEPSLSISINGGALKPLAASSPESVLQQNSVRLVLNAGTAAAQGYPAPTYKWIKKDPVTGVSQEISGATQAEYSIPSVSLTDRAYYSVIASNSEGAPVESDAVLLDVQGPPSLTVLSMTIDGGTVSQSVNEIQERIVDKKVSPGITLRANVDASDLPNYVWKFTSDADKKVTNIVPALTSVVGNGVSLNGAKTYVELSVADFSEDGNGVFTLTVSVPAKNGAPSVVRECSWHVTVKPPTVTILSMTALDGGTTQSVGTVQDITVDKKVSSSLLLRANVQSSDPLTYAWTFTSVYPTPVVQSVKIDSAGTSVLGTGITVTPGSDYGQLEVMNFSDDASGVLKLTITASKKSGQPWVTKECSWRVTVKPPSIAIVSRTVGGYMAPNGGVSLLDPGVTQEVVVDKTRAKVGTEVLRLTANFDASALPDCNWTFTSDYDGLTKDATQVGTSTPLKQLNYAVLSFADLPDDADGVYTMTRQQNLSTRQSDLWDRGRHPRRSNCGSKRQEHTAPWRLVSDSPNASDPYIPLAQRSDDSCFNREPFEGAAGDAKGHRRVHA